MVSENQSGEQMGTETSSEDPHWHGMTVPPLTVSLFFISTGDGLKELGFR